mmetsp:Transcript_12045/g.37677  ORF Transcript_12045/g.37677 Transcript_12045/m.37677 type:complete len:352 (-) Transcript_12045:443-1498(-)
MPASAPGRHSAGGEVAAAPGLRAPAGGAAASAAAALAGAGAFGADGHVVVANQAAATFLAPAVPTPSPAPGATGTTVIASRFAPAGPWSVPAAAAVLGCAMAFAHVIFCVAPSGGAKFVVASTVMVAGRVVTGGSVVVSGVVVVACNVVVAARVVVVGRVVVGGKVVVSRRAVVSGMVVATTGVVVVGRIALVVDIDTAGAACCNVELWVAAAVVGTSVGQPRLSCRQHQAFLVSDQACSQPKRPATQSQGFDEPRAGSCDVAAGAGLGGPVAARAAAPGQATARCWQHQAFLRADQPSFQCSKPAVQSKVARDVVVVPRPSLAVVVVVVSVAVVPRAHGKPLTTACWRRG